MNRLDESLDGVLLLLDRQIIDSKGQMVAKVDDVELTEGSDETLVLSGLLTGAAALVPRLGEGGGQFLHRLWVDMGRQYADRGVPGWISLSDVDELGSAVVLNVPRDRLVIRQPAAEEGRPSRRRLSQLLGMPVQLDGRSCGKVLDVRFEGRGPAGSSESAHETRAQPRLTALVVGRGRPGSRLGYDRHPERGPRLLSVILHRLQHDRGLVELDGIETIDWERGLVRISRTPRDLPEP